MSAASGGKARHRRHHVDNDRIRRPRPTPVETRGDPHLHPTLYPDPDHYTDEGDDGGLGVHSAGSDDTRRYDTVTSLALSL